MINKMLMINLYPSSLPDNHLDPHSIIIASLELFNRIKIRMITSLYPHVKFSIISPASSH